MRIVLQRVSQAAVTVEGREVARIGRGLLLLVGAERGDTEPEVERLAQKVAQLRVFEDEQGKMNRSVQEVGGELLVVSQLTLCADLTKGTRPSFDPAESPERARQLIGSFVAALCRAGLRVQEGQFGARMAVSLVNEGPVTFTW